MIRIKDWPAGGSVLGLPVLALSVLVWPVLLYRAEGGGWPIWRMKFSKAVSLSI